MKSDTTPRGCLGFLFKLFTGDEQDEKQAAFPKIQINKYFISDAEADFFRVLTRVVSDRGHILAQVSLKQLFWLPGRNQDTPGRATWQNKINQKAVDFVVCDPATLRPLLAIELDEPSHTRADRIIRDEELKKMFEAAGLVLLREPTCRTYDTRQLAQRVLPHLGTQ